MDAFWRDLRFAIRGLARSRGFTLIAALTLALGIGANTAIFSVVNAVLLRPLSYTRPDQLVSVRANLVGRNRRDVPMSQPEYQDISTGVPALHELAAVWPININLTGLGEPERIQAAVVSYNYFSVLGAAPVLGRNFTKADDQGKIGYVALISYDLWRNRFGGDRGIIGKTVHLDDDPITIIGVMPRGFRHPVESGASPMELWAPIALDNPDTNFVNTRGARVFDLIGRMQPGATLDQTRAQLAGLCAPSGERLPQCLSGQPRVAGRRGASGGTSGRKCPPGAAGAVGRRGVRASHRMLERGEPAPGAGDDPRPGDRDQNRAWRQPEATHPSVAHREPRACNGGGTARSAPRGLGDECTGSSCGPISSTRSRDHHRPDRSRRSPPFSFSLPVSALG